jgi:hypothetical protein
MEGTHILTEEYAHETLRPVVARPTKTSDFDTLYSILNTSREIEKQRIVETCSSQGLMADKFQRGCLGLSRDAKLAGEASPLTARVNARVPGTFTATRWFLGAASSYLGITYSSLSFQAPDRNSGLDINAAIDTRQHGLELVEAG